MVAMLKIDKGNLKTHIPITNNGKQIVTSFVHRKKSM